MASAELAPGWRHVPVALRTDRQGPGQDEGGISPAAEKDLGF